MGPPVDMADFPVTAVSAAVTPLPVLDQHPASPHVPMQAADLTVHRYPLADGIPEPSIVPASVCDSAPIRDLGAIVTGMDTAAVGVMDILTWAAESIPTGGGTPTPPTIRISKIRSAWPMR